MTIHAPDGCRRMIELAIKFFADAKNYDPILKIDGCTHFQETQQAVEETSDTKKKNELIDSLYFKHCEKCEEKCQVNDPRLNNG